MDSKVNKTVLIKVSYLVNLGEHEDDLLDSMTSQVSHDQNIMMDREARNLEWVGTSTLELTPHMMNCGKCANCARWTTDREKPNPIMELCNGATVDGRLLCDECLPEHHRWAF